MSRSRAWWGLASTAVVGAAAYASCAIYDSSLLLPDAGGDAPVVSDAGDGGSTCAHLLPPPRPAADDPSDADVTIINVIQYVDFGLDGGVYGYDLDRTCTCPDPESCVPSPTAKPHCDGEGGTDNAGGALIATFAALSPMFDPTGSNAVLQSGRGSLLVRVTNYNGKANDTSVHVDVFISNGTVPLDDAGNNPPPSHDGGDLWSVDPASVVGTPPPYVASHEDTAAYVSEGVIVGTVDFPLGLGLLNPDFLQLHGAYVTATVVQTPQGLALHQGLISGRWDTRNLLTGLEAVKDPFDKTQYLCGTDPTYQALKVQICQAADITRLVQNDNTGAPCDAISLALSFTAEPALLGGVLAPNKPLPTPCGTSYSDQCGN